MTKYKQYFQKMVSDNKNVFEEFQKIHDSYSLDQNKWQGRYNKEGEKILEIVREYENRLCANTERGLYNKFSAGLAEKFQNEVRKHFPMIDYIGIKVSYEEPHQDVFTIKKINLT